MKTAIRENPNFWVQCSGAQRMVWPIETFPAHSMGLESKTISGGGVNFSLDFPFYRTGQRGDHRVWRRVERCWLEKSFSEAFVLRAIPGDYRARPESWPECHGHLA